MILFIYLYNSPSLDRIIFYVAPCERRRSFLLFALEAMLPRTFPFAICFLFIIESLFSRGRAVVVWGDAREYWKLTCEDYRVDLFSQSDSEPRHGGWCEWCSTTSEEGFAWSGLRKFGSEASWRYSLVVVKNYWKWLDNPSSNLKSFT